MEANIVLKAEDLTSDFADGLLKVFGKAAVLNIKVEYELNTGSLTSGAANTGSTQKTPLKRGRKPGSKVPVKTNDATPKKRGRKPKVASKRRM